MIEFIELEVVIGVAGATLVGRTGTLIELALVTELPLLLDLLDLETVIVAVLDSDSLEISDWTGDKSTKTKSFGLPGLFFGLLKGGLLIVNFEAAATIFNELFKHSIDELCIGDELLVLLLAVAVVDAIDEVEHDLLDFSSIGEVVDLFPGKLLLRWWVFGVDFLTLHNFLPLAGGKTLIVDAETIVYRFVVGGIKWV